MDKKDKEAEDAEGFDEPAQERGPRVKGKVRCCSLCLIPSFASVSSCMACLWQSTAAVMMPTVFDAAPWPRRSVGLLSPALVVTALC